MEIRKDLISRDEIVKDLQSMPKSYKNTMLDLLDYTKVDFLYRSTKGIWELNQILFRNGGLTTLSEIKKSILDAWHKPETTFWEVTGKVLDTPKKKEHLTRR